MDFIEDRLVTGRKFPRFNIGDAFSRNSLAADVDISLPEPLSSRFWMDSPTAEAGPRN